MKPDTLEERVRAVLPCRFENLEGGVLACDPSRERKHVCDNCRQRPAVLALLREVDAEALARGRMTPCSHDNDEREQMEAMLYDVFGDQVTFDDVPDIANELIKWLTDEAKLQWGDSSRNALAVKLRATAAILTVLRTIKGAIK